MDHQMIWPELFPAGWSLGTLHNKESNEELVAKLPNFSLIQGT
jgi:hypothetical protein